MKSVLTLVTIGFTHLVFSQSITVEADNYRHIFEGGGVSMGLFMGHHWSMNEANQDKAVQFINRDCNMVYLQDYVANSTYPPMDDAYFDKRANYVKAAKKYRQDVQFAITTNRFPQTMVEEINIGGKVQPVLKTSDPDIYNKVAQFYFNIFQGYKIRGVDIDIINVVNEPDFEKQYYYGHNGDNYKAVALLFAEAVPKFKALLRDTAINKLKIKIPKVMGVSTIGPNSCALYLRYFKQNYPRAWTEIDIVAVHQYNNGSNEAFIAGVNIEAEGKPFFQSEMHTNRGDNLGVMPIDSSHRGILSLANTMGAAIRNGVGAWFYFQTNYPHPYTVGGLISVPWQTNNPVPYPHYYAFKQMTSTQPAYSNVVGRTVLDFNSSEVFCFRKKNEDTVYVHIANYMALARTATLDMRGIGNTYTIKGFTQIVTDATLKSEVTTTVQNPIPTKTITPNLRPYSVTTLKIALKKEAATAVKEQPAEGHFSIFQTGDRIVVQSKNSQRLQNLRIYNASGQLMGNFKSIESEQLTIPIADWIAGIYVFNIKNDKGSFIQKMMINK